MDIVAYSLSAAGLILGAVAGWFIRHNVLTRHLAQSKKQLEEIRALHMTVEHEMSSLRQKLIHQNDSQEKLTSAVQKAENKTHDTELKLKEIDELQEKITQLNEDSDILQEQIAYLESEKVSQQKYRKQAQNKLKLVSDENTELRNKIKTIQAEKEKITKLLHSKPVGLPRVRRIDPKDWDELKNQQPDENLKEQTSRIKQSKSTDRFSSRAKKEQGATTGFQPKTAPVEILEDDFQDEVDSSQQKLFPELDPPPAVEPGNEPAPEAKPVFPSIPEPTFPSTPEPEPEPETEPEPFADLEPIVDPILEQPDDANADDADFEDELEGTDPGVFPQPEPSLHPQSIDTPEPEKDLEHVEGAAGVPFAGVEFGQTVQISPDDIHFSKPKADEAVGFDDADEAMMQTVQDGQAIELDEPRTPQPPKPIAKPSRELDNKEHVWGDAPDLTAEKQTKPDSLSSGRKGKRKRKKKPATVRTDITSSDIIDSFKKELGLPE